MDTGSARSRFNIYGQKDYLGTLYHGLLQYHWSIHKLLIGTIFYYMEYGRLLFIGDEAIYHKWIIALDIITTMLISINGTLTCCIQVMSTTQFLPQMSPSPMFVYIQEYASLQSTYLIMLVPLV